MTVLQIDVTVTGPDSVMTGTVAVTVNPPAPELPPPLPAPELPPPPNLAWRWTGR